MTLLRPHFLAAGGLPCLMLVVWCASLAGQAESAADTDDNLRIEVTKKGPGKQVVISEGASEWFMLIEVTPENAVIIKQEKHHDRYVVDESETHDRPMTPEEVDAAISDYVNSVKTLTQKN